MHSPPVRPLHQLRRYDTALYLCTCFFVFFTKDAERVKVTVVPTCRILIVQDSLLFSLSIISFPGFSDWLID